MRKLFLLLAIVSFASFTTTTFGQLLDEKNVTVTMDLQPILQLNMTTPDQVEFIFDDIRDYYAGITKHGATVLKVSATVNWDLWAVGTSSNANFWDESMTYGNVNPSASATTSLPLSALELFQYPANAQTTGFNGAWADYSKPFSGYDPATQNWNMTNQGSNNIYHSAAVYIKPATSEKFIYGHSNEEVCGEGGSYMVQQSKMPGQADAVTGDFYYFVIDYRIVPGLPVTFPLAASNVPASEALTYPTFAQPGVYNMNVKYILAED